MARSPISARRRAFTRWRTSVAAIATGLFLGCAGCSHAPLPPESATTTTGRTYAPAAPELGIEHAANVAPGVYRGAQPTHQGFVNLRNQGFHTVVNLRSFHSERSEVEALGMKSVEIPMRADVTCEPPSEAAVFKFLDTVLDPANQPVFFHCAQGRDRTGTMAAIYRMEVQGWSPAEALEEMRAFGCSEVYQPLIRYVESYRTSGIWESRPHSRPSTPRTDRDEPLSSADASRASDTRP